MSVKHDRARYLQNWRNETNAVFLYEKLALAETHPGRADLFRELADVEKKHARFWEERMLAAGGTLPRNSVNLRIRLLVWLAQRFGVKMILPSLAALEQGAVSEYDDQPEAVAARMPQAEQSHARVFGAMNDQDQGLAGGAIARLEGRHRSLGGNALRAGVLGANDGLVSNLSLVMGVAGAQVSGSGILITGLAGMLAGAISMALGEWLSVQSSRELYQRQIAVEKSELEKDPAEEQEELALIYQAKGLPAAQAQALAERLLSDPTHALDTLAREELGIDPEALGGSAWVAAFTSFLLFALGAIMPVAPFFFVHGSEGVLWSLGASSLGLFVIGAGITLVTGKNPIGAGLRQILIGLV
ncbi:MAG: rubrerythrin family protein, partial [Candidatus Firestonebacteria bacterium]|nr:rubrerythrin family protein [Candidatus Firestonebacteria bacterium]